MTTVRYCAIGEKKSLLSLIATSNPLATSYHLAIFYLDFSPYLPFSEQCDKTSTCPKIRASPKSFECISVPSCGWNF